jgi:hypothetical protein
MKILTHLIRHIHVGEWFPPRMADQWVDGFQINAVRINEKRLQKIPDETRYQTNLVGTAVKKYKNMVNPTFISRSGLTAKDIIDKHSANLQRSYKKYEGKLKRAYETVDGVTAKRFKDAVAASKEHYAKGMAARTLPFTGTRADGLGAAPLVALWLTNDSIVEGVLSGMDKLIAGGPMMLTKPRRGNSFKAAINQRLIQAGATIVKSSYDQAVIDSENDETNDMVDGFVNPALNLYKFKTDGESHINYINAETEGFYLELKVTQK